MVIPNSMIKFNIAIVMQRKKNATLVVSYFSVIGVIFHFYDAFTGNHISNFTLRINCMELVIKN